jgi:hypothetical protein
MSGAKVQYMSALMRLTSPRLRGEVGSPLAIRVRGANRESRCVESPFQPNPLPGSGERKSQPRAILRT